MPNRVRTWLQASLKVGFWFPCFQTAIRVTYNGLSLEQYFNRWVAGGVEVARGASELYQFLRVSIGVAWVSFIDTPVHPLFARQFFQLAGVVFALYLVSELFLFLLHWTFVAGGRLHDLRRSLAGFLLNLFEIAVYFSISFALAGCDNSHKGGWTAVYANLRSAFKLELVATRETTPCCFITRYEIVVAATLLVIVIASLVGAVVRPEEENKAS